MAVALPDLAPAAFAAGALARSPEPLPAEALERLHGHYQELRRWSGRLSLIGPGTADEVLDRHFGESLAALPWLPEPGGRLVDIGSGAGFPGLVIAAARPGWEVTLVEAQERKWAFLQSAARRARLSCRCLNARVAALLPPGFPDAYEAVTVRALRLPLPVLTAIAERLTSGGRLLLWAGAEAPVLPEGWQQRGEIRLAGAASRRVLKAERA
jgi:16S rRNA (guanine527-N7)-methyltransferase